MSDIDYDKKYIEYAELMTSISATESDLDNKRRRLNDIKSELSYMDGIYGLELSAHAIANISSRIEHLARENSHIYIDVMNHEDPTKSLIWPSNMKSFIISIIAHAKSKGDYNERKSRNNPDHKEYHFDIEIGKWRLDNKKLNFIAIVESNIIKTGYFNWD